MEPSKDQTIVALQLYPAGIITLAECREMLNLDPLPAVRWKPINESTFTYNVKPSDGPSVTVQLFR